MGGMLYKLFASASLLTLGLYHLVCTFFHVLKSPQSYAAKPFYPLPRVSGNNNRLQKLPLIILILSLSVAFLHQTLISFYSDPLVKGSTPVHRFSSLNSAAVFLLFLLVAVYLLLSESASSLVPLPSDLLFALASGGFFLHYSAATASASIQTSDLQAHCDSLSARVSALCSLLCLLLACRPRLFVADAALAASVCLQGLWQLQTGLSLYVDGFIPEGCHRLLDVSGGVEGSTQCDIQESKLRAVSVLDLMFTVHVVLVVILLFVTYTMVAMAAGVRRTGSYEALPNNSSDSSNHIQMNHNAMSSTPAASPQYVQYLDEEDEEEEEDDEKYPDLRHSLFEAEGSVIDMVKHSKEDKGEEFRLEDEIDNVADLFITRFHRQMWLQKQLSLENIQDTSN
ncbi:hypothetical protein F2Q68_00022810 [Brassica cretica]|uniref:Uncharacterized protein n=1 Tax=Brassica cretica TaxID=69181 RepID=A0A8S9FYL3_BRACR|nr:hypothetical protein F2Q68_00022810 [Brassica cretica]